MSDNEVSYGESFLTTVIRGNYISLAEKDSGHKFSTDKYCMTLLLPKDDKEGLRQIIDAITEAAQVDSLADIDKHPLIDDEGDERDGDAEHMKDTEGYAGHYYFKVSSKDRPICWDATESDDPIEVEDLDEIKANFYNGAYYQVILQPYYMEMQEKKGTKTLVTFFLKHVIKLQDGKKLSGDGARVDKDRCRQLILSGLKRPGNTEKGKTTVSSLTSKKKIAKKEVVEAEVETEVEETPIPQKRRAKRTSSLTSVLDN